MRQEILAAKGLLSDLRRTLIELDIQAKGLITHIRSELSPFEDDVTVLRVDEAHASASRLAAIVHQMKDTKARIVRIEADLGREA